MTPGQGRIITQVPRSGRSLTSNSREHLVPHDGSWGPDNQLSAIRS